MELQPCPQCGSMRYRYGRGLTHFFAESLETGTAVVKGKSTLLIGKIVSGGGGIFSLPKLFYQGVFQDKDGYPLLACTHCGAYVVACRKCLFFMLLPEHPPTASLIRCPKCSWEFQVTESDEDFAQLVTR